jgi:hypothetical protein
LDSIWGAVVETLVDLGREAEDSLSEDFLGGEVRDKVDFTGSVILSATVLSDANSVLDNGAEAAWSGEEREVSLESLGPNLVVEVELEGWDVI